MLCTEVLSNLAGILGGRPELLLFNMDYIAEGEFLWNLRLLTII